MYVLWRGLLKAVPRFKGVYNLYEHKLNLFQPSKQVVTEKVEVDINTEELDNQIGAPLAEKLRGRTGTGWQCLSWIQCGGVPERRDGSVFFGSALNNFGVQELLDTFVEIAPSCPTKTEEREVETDEPEIYRIC